MLILKKLSAFWVKIEWIALETSDVRAWICSKYSQKIIKLNFNVFIVNSKFELIEEYQNSILECSRVSVLSEVKVINEINLGKCRSGFFDIFIYVKWKYPEKGLDLFPCMQGDRSGTEILNSNNNIYMTINRQACNGVTCFNRSFFKDCKKILSVR